jgi:hypothetical protein
MDLNKEELTRFGNDTSRSLLGIQSLLLLTSLYRLTRYRVKRQGMTYKQLESEELHKKVPSMKLWQAIDHSEKRSFPQLP